MEDLSEAEQDTFKKALAGLTGLDTHQADDGMPLVMLHTTDLRKKAVYSFMAMMEQIHAKSYSHIFTTLLPSSETNYLLDEWVLEEPHLKYKSDKIVANYHKLWGKEASISTNIWPDSCIFRNILILLRFLLSTISCWSRENDDIR